VFLEEIVIQFADHFNDKEIFDNLDDVISVDDDKITDDGNENHYEHLSETYEKG